MRREDDFSRCRSELAPVLRLAGLHHHWMSLNRARCVERTLDAEMSALVVDVVHLVRVVEAAARLVTDEGVVLPAVPQGLHGLDMLMRAGVSVGMVWLLVAVEVSGRIVAGRRHHVPTRPTARQQVERGEFAGKSVRLLIGRRGRCDEADM